MSNPENYLEGDGPEGDNLTKAQLQSIGGHVPMIVWNRYDFRKGEYMDISRYWTTVEDASYTYYDYFSALSFCHGS